MSPMSAEELERWTLEKQAKACRELIQLLERFLDFERWNFKQSHVQISSEYPPSVIYDSEWCRVDFSLGGGDMWGSPEMSVRYGRLHAPNDKAVMVWNGEECLCWHDEFKALDFLDGLSPQEAIDRLSVKHEWPHVAEQFRRSEIGRKLSREHHPEFVTRMEATIWEHYGQRLFELYDLRRPDLWEQYRQFLKEVYDIKGRSPNIKPPLDKAC